MDAALVIMVMQRAAAESRRANIRPTWRKNATQARRKDGLRKHTAEIRDIRYGD